MGERERPTPAQREEGLRLKAARQTAGLTQSELARRVGVEAFTTISRWERGVSAVQPAQRHLVAEVLGVPESEIWRNGKTPARSLGLPAASEWPQAWRQRVYGLQAEAAKVEASEDELATVKRFMLDPEIQLLWKNSTPPADLLKRLEGIEIGVREWLRLRGRMVKSRG